MSGRLSNPHALPCMFCLAPDNVILRQDKKGRPFSRCRACGAKTFMYRPESLRGFRLLAPSVMAVIQQLWARGHEWMQAEDVRAKTEMDAAARYDPWGKEAGNG